MKLQNRYWKILFAGLIMVVIVGVAVPFLTLTSEPSYNGKTLTEWLQSSAAEGEAGATHDESTKAIEFIGTNALPTLLKLASASDGGLKRTLTMLVDGQNIVRIHILTAHEKYDLADMGFSVLGTNARPAFKELVTLTKHSDPEVRGHALGFLSFLHPSTNAFFPVLETCLHDPDAHVQYTAATVIIYGYPHEAEKLGVYQVFPELKITERKSRADTTH